MSRETWDNILTDTEREHLLKYLPQESTDEQKQDMIKYTLCVCICYISLENYLMERILNLAIRLVSFGTS